MCPNPTFRSYISENYRSAVTDCEKARELDAKNVKTYFRAAKALCALGKYPEAVEWCDAGLELEPENTSLIKVGLRPAA